MKRFIGFAGRVTVAHVVTYIAAGALADPLPIKRLAAIAGLYIVLGQWASTIAGSGTIEGWLILRPELTSPDVVVKAMAEGLVQGLALSAWFAWWVRSLPLATADREV